MGGIIIPDNASSFNSNEYDSHIASVLPYYREYSAQIIDLINSASQDMEFESEFDVVTAVQCHHYLHPEERRAAVTKCYNALRNGGVFVAFENIKMTTDESEKIALQRWAKYQADHGLSEVEIGEHLGRRGVNMFPITIE